MISLSPCVRVIPDQGVIVDLRLDISHRVSEEALPLLTLLGAGVPYGHISTLAMGYRISNTQLTDLLGFLNTLGGLHVQRDCISQIKSIFERSKHLLVGIVFCSLIRRQPCTPWGILVSIIRATTPVTVAALVVTGLITAGNFLTPDSALLCLIWGLSSFIGSLWAHETAHLMFIKASGTESDILQSNLRIGLIHARLAPRTEFASAIVGPLTGILFGALLAVLAYSLYLPSLAVIACCVALFHFSSFLPWYGDGASIQRSIKFFGENYGNPGRDRSDKI